MAKPSAAYDRALAESTKHHASSNTFSGKFLRPHKPFLMSLIDRLEIKSALDYGCGKGAQYTWVDQEDGKTLEQAFGFEVSKYDPAWPPYAAEPVGPFDLVICTHVLGSIPTVDLDWVLARLYSLATKAVYISEKIGPVKKKVFSKPEEHPIGWTPKQWLVRIVQFASSHSVETHVSFRTRDEENGVQIARHVRGWGCWL
jgi:hypothetical protein